jgi:prolipoprotein diacylglyceryl transferase
LIEWNVSPEIVSIGPITLRWYGLLFALSFIVGLQIFAWIFKKEGKKEKDLNDLLLYMILGTVLGARLGHCLFYNPSYYLSNPLEILMVWKGGLASHGAAVGILFSLYLYSKKKADQSFLWIVDRIVIVVALSGFFIRMGNLFNSEIIGKPTDVAWSFVFTSVDNIPRHPAQLYEALAYLAIFIILFNIYRLKNIKLNEGFLFGLFLVLVFGFRFFVEYFKKEQEIFEQNMMMNMGQLLSVPLVILGIYILIRSRKVIHLQQ